MAVFGCVAIVAEAATGPTTQMVAPLSAGNGSVNVHVTVLTCGSVTLIPLSGTLPVFTIVNL